MSKVGVVGPSHLGLIWANTLASKGFDVSYFKPRRLEIYEPGLKELIEKNIESKNLEYRVSYSSLSECEVVFMAYDTPITEDNKIKLDLIERVISAIISNLNDTAILIIISQVPPGFCRKINLDKKRLFHQVDTLIYGQSIDRACKPKNFIIGGETAEFSLPSAYNEILDAAALCFFVTYEEAEIYKLSMNAMLSAQIAVTNTMANLCQYYDANWNHISQALSYESRVGSYHKPGLGIGGGHMTRDLHTVELLSRKHGFQSGIIGASLASSYHMRYWAVRQLRRLGYNLDERKIAVWGLSYKTGTDSVKDSPAIFTIKEFPNCTFIAHDPQVKMSLPNLTMVKNPLDAVEEDTDALLIMTDHQEYKDIKLGKDLRMTIIDPYKVLQEVPEHCLYRGLG